MSLLPALFRNQDPMPALGRKVEAPAPKKPDLIAAFEKGDHRPAGAVIFGIDRSKAGADITVVCKPVGTQECRKWERVETYGGKLAENAVQSAPQPGKKSSRDLALARFQRRRTELKALGLTWDVADLVAASRKSAGPATAEDLLRALAWIEKRAFDAGFGYDAPSGRFFLKG